MSSKSTEDKSGQPVDGRLTTLKDWLVNDLGIQFSNIELASGDASFRRYFRVLHNNKTHIVMDAPPEKEDCEPYIRNATAMLALGLNVPEIIATDLEHGFLLISDLGDCQYLDKLDETSAERLYQDAFSALLVLQRHDVRDQKHLPNYDQALLSAELELFREWYLEKHLGKKLNDKQHNVLDKVFCLLVESALEQPKVWVHRDYHSRNLMITEHNNPGILDFQDAVFGPVTYDLVSLLRDCYIQWPNDQVNAWITTYYRQLMEHELISNVTEEKFIRWFDLMGVQRHFKATGIFARLNTRDGKPGYLKDIPRTLNYVSEVSKRYPDLKHLSSFIAEL